jgi:hypothetical protein
MKKQTIFGIFALSILTTGCKVTKQTKGDFDVMYITKTGIIQRPLVADLQVSDKRQSLTKTYNNALVSEAKENVIADFIKQYNCDLAVQPFFSTTTTSSDRASVTVTITAYTGNYKNMRDFQLSDTLFININHSINSPKEREVQADPNTKKKLILTAPKTI